MGKNLMIVVWTVAIILEIYLLKKNIKSVKLIVPVLFTIFFVIAGFGELTYVYYGYVILSWLLILVNLFTNKKNKNIEKI